MMTKDEIFNFKATSKVDKLYKRCSNVMRMHDNTTVWTIDFHEEVEVPVLEKLIEKLQSKRFVVKSYQDDKKQSSLTIALPAGWIEDWGI